MHHYSLWKGSILLAFPGVLHASPKTFVLGVDSTPTLETVSFSQCSKSRPLCVDVLHFLFEKLLFSFKRHESLVLASKERKNWKDWTSVNWIASRSDKEKGKLLSSFVVGMVYYCCKRPDCWLSSPRCSDQ